MRSNGRTLNLDQYVTLAGAVELTGLSRNQILWAAGRGDLEYVEVAPNCRLYPRDGLLHLRDLRASGQSWLVTKREKEAVAR